ncbi:uncharacterized protein LOC133306100 [Gastrolobium bilobum]|uniref:uncharacterized protein LOC133306100 n=1 Tax=Gastrolobium bilobum TaxID=150636 RepID=UPI002AB079F6|nr:uncharacterized protein LOC133306100 [Gastrolobium bilobum]
MTSKGTDTTGQPNTECCMCGDLGFSDQLFQCKVCQFRSQHRYCSNIYPKDESLGTCNWCLSQKEDTKDKSPNSPNSSSSHRNNSSADDESKGKKIKNSNSNSNSAQTIVGRKGLRGSALHLQLQKPIKKHKSPEARSPSTSTSPSVLISTRKRIITNGSLEEKLRRTRSADIITNTSSGATKQVFRNKVRRYKLLDEVSS